MNSEKQKNKEISDAAAGFAAHIYIILFIAAVVLFLLWGLVHFITLEFLIISELVLIGIDAIYTGCIIIVDSL